MTKQEMIDKGMELAYKAAQDAFRKGLIADVSLYPENRGCKIFDDFFLTVTASGGETVEKDGRKVWSFHHSINWSIDPWYTEEQNWNRLVESIAEMQQVISNYKPKED